MERIVREKETDWKGLFKSFFGSSDEIDYENKSEREIIMKDNSLSPEDKELLIKSLSTGDNWAKKLFFHHEKIKKGKKKTNIPVNKIEKENQNKTIEMKKSKEVEDLERDSRG